jgi:hypothetical protein
MPDPSLVNSVFNNAYSVIQGTQAAANAAFTAVDSIKSIADNTAETMSSFSRRDNTYPQMQQPVQYQPSTYPWAAQTYNGYNFGQQNQFPNGYPGITNPSYGKNGFYTGNSGWMSQSSSFMNQNQPMGTAWFNQGIWG